MRNLLRTPCNKQGCSGSVRFRPWDFLLRQAQLDRIAATCPTCGTLHVFPLAWSLPAQFATFFSAVLVPFALLGKINSGYKLAALVALAVLTWNIAARIACRLCFACGMHLGLIPRA